MNCKVCGTRLGILERWRYGDFCSQDHREVFALDLAELDKKLVAETPVENTARPEATSTTKPASRKPDAKAAAKPLGSEETAAEDETSQDLTAEAEPEPPMAGFVHQGDATPCDPAKRKETERRAVPEKTEKPSEMWRAMARKAEKDELPPLNPSALKGRDLPSIVVEAPQENVPAPGGFFLHNSYAAMSPPAGAPIRVQGMPQPGLTGPPAGFWGAGFAVSTPFVPAQPSHWVDEQGWHWISDSAAMTSPTVDSVLSMYPMVAPWTNWPMVAPGTGMRPMQPPGALPGAPQPVPGMGAAPGMNPAAAHRGQAAAPPAHSAPPAGMAAPFPAQQRMEGAVPGAPGDPGQMPSMPRAGLGLGMPSGFGPASFGPPSLGGMGPGVAGGLFGGGQVVGWGMQQQPGYGPMPQSGPGYSWRELPPPFFSALVDLSFGVRPMDASRVFLTPPNRHEDWPVETPQRPPLRLALPSGLLPAQQSSLQCDPANSVLPAPSEPAARPAWPDSPAAQPAGPGLPRPRVPRRVAPAVVLPLGSRLGLPKPAEPLMLAGSGIHGGRAI